MKLYHRSIYSIPVFGREQAVKTAERLLGELMPVILRFHDNYGGYLVERARIEGLDPAADELALTPRITAPGIPNPFTFCTGDFGHILGAFVHSERGPLREYWAEKFLWVVTFEDHRLVHITGQDNKFSLSYHLMVRSGPNPQPDPPDVVTLGAYNTYAAGEFHGDERTYYRWFDHLRLVVGHLQELYGLGDPEPDMT
jgi:hypothetical protein